jgi:hypothetical protein
VWTSVGRIASFLASNVTAAHNAEILSGGKSKAGACLCRSGFWPCLVRRRHYLDLDLDTTLIGIHYDQKD